MTDIDKARTVLRVIVSAILEAVKEADKTSVLKGIPSGHLYATLNGFGLQLDTYMAIIEALKKSGQIKVTNHLITLP